MWPFFGRSVTSEARRRGIAHLLHSTHLFQNLPYIIKDKTLHTAGSLIEREGRDRALRFLHDPRRYERFAVGLNFVNCSISFPNVELLYHRSKSNWKSEWVHLALDPSRLQDRDTRFCPVSAAAEYGKHIGEGAAGFRAMFAEEVEGKRRDKLPRNVPTHPQAEVLIRGPLPLTSLTALIVPSGSVAQEVERLCDLHGVSVRVEILPQLFVWPPWLIRES